MQFQACAYCDHPNPVGTNYCNDCGAALHLKPCRHCGAIAAAQARHCPACQAAFPVRPMVDVDIPWAVPADRPPVAGNVHGPSNARPTGGSRPVADADDASPALLATRRLIEKAAERANEPAEAKALVLPPRFDRTREDRGHDLPGTERSDHPAMRADPLDAMPAKAPIELAILAPRPAAAPSRRSHIAPVIVLSALGLVIAVALLFLIDYAAMRDRVREVASPLKILHPGVAVSTPEAGTAATTGSTDVAPAVSTDTTGNGQVPGGALPTGAGAGAAATAATSSMAAPPPTTAATSSHETIAAPPASPVPATTPAAAAAQPDATPASAVAPASSTTPPPTMSTMDSLPMAGAPAQVDPAPGAVPVEPAACRTELQALGLCSKGVR
jgi:hypothetical protein